jgi:hypothetical protein
MRLFALIVALLVFTSCGPIEYVNQVTRRASARVEAARVVQADRHAPYWYTLAVEYLKKAREEAAHADYQAANRFGRRAAEAAERAKEVALKKAQEPAAGPAEEPVKPASEEEDPLKEQP